DGGQYRRRRYATFASESGEIAPRPAEPHYQSSSYNPLNGGIARHFAPFAPEATTHPCSSGSSRDADASFARSAPGAHWHVEAHQFRISAGSENAGSPTPEGSHRDGVDRVSVQSVARHNVIGGVTRITDPARRPSDRTTSTVPGDLYSLDDRRTPRGQAGATCWWSRSVGGIDRAGEAQRQRGGAFYVLQDDAGTRGRHFGRPENSPRQQMVERGEVARGDLQDHVGLAGQLSAFQHFVQLQHPRAERLRRRDPVAVHGEQDIGGNAHPQPPGIERGMDQPGGVGRGAGPQRGRPDRRASARPRALAHGVRAEERQADERGGEPDEHALRESADGGRHGSHEDGPDERGGGRRGDADGRRVPSGGATHRVSVGEPVQRGRRLARQCAHDEHDEGPDAREHGEGDDAPQQVVRGGEEQIDPVRLLRDALYQHNGTFARLSSGSHPGPTRARCPGPMTIALAAPDQRAWLDSLTGPDAEGSLAAALGADGAGLGTWRVHQVHARPGAEVTVGYDVVARRTLPARPGGAVASVDATAYSLATTAPLPPDAVGPGVARSEDGPRVVHVWRHPADPLSPALAAACDAPGLTRRSDDAGVLAPGEAVESVAMVAY
ncbi:hypothetical protein OY671_007494, partial [Metschnikowia pulcherrima]